MGNIKYLNPEDKKQFESYSSFPGEEGNPFDKILRALDKINRIPSFLFVFFLFFLDGILTIFNINNWIILFAFSMSDTLVISLAPALKISFGSYKSQVLILTILRSVFIWLPYPYNLLLQIIGVLLVIYGFLIEPSEIKISIMRHKFGNSNEIVHFIHLADIHLEQLSLRELKILKIIKQKKPDFVLFTGDFLNLSNNRDSKSIKEIITFLNQINSISPIYYVTGSPAVDLEESVHEISNNITAIHLKNDNHLIRVGNVAINLIGITCSHRPHLDVIFLPQLIDPKKINFLLYHSPDIIYEIKETDKLKLILSGHTHGGQVCLPIIGALFTGSLYGRTLQSGLYKIHDTMLYISRGIGLEGLGAPRVRFLCPPEIIEWLIEI
ncbi:MAG TPA: metallophosphoesterase [Anaerolineaceae bacterium]|nr:metallophosphoesterase [Anaerolineaceae bacterium]